MKFFKDKDFYPSLIIWFIIIFWYLTFAYNFFYPFRIRLQDKVSSQAFYVFSRPPSCVNKIVIVAIDSASRQHLRVKWPWPRKITARLLRNIIEFSPKVVGLDIIFAGKSSPEDDEELISVLKSYPHTVLAYTLSKKGSEYPWEGFRKVAPSLGFVNRPGEEDRVVRSTRTFYIDREWRTQYSLDTQILTHYFNIEKEEIKVELAKGISLGEKLFVPSSMGITPLNYLAHPNDFVIVPAFLVLNKKVNPEIFKDKIVLVGATDPLIHDVWATPIGVFPGVIVIANSLVMMLSGRFLYHLPLAVTILFSLGIGMGIMIINKKFSLSISSLITFVVLVFSYFLLLYLRAKDVQVDYFTFFFLGISSYLVPNAYKYSYAIYMGTRLKNLAIRDPLTGFYTFRYFSLKIEEALRKKAKSIGLVIIMFSNYKRLFLDLSFEQLKGLIRLLSNFIQVGVSKEFKQFLFSRISEDLIGIVFLEEEREKIEKFLKNLLEEAKRREFKLEDYSAKVFFRGAILYKKKGVYLTREDLFSKLESFLKEFRKERGEFTVLELEESEGETKATFSPWGSWDFLITEIEERNKELEKTLKEVLDAKKKTEETYFELIYSLIKALEEKDTYTQGHSERVANYAKAIAKEAGLDEEECELIYKAGLLHDIGKIGIPDYILHKKEKLTPQERELIKKHEVMSVEILKPIKAFQQLLPIILHHHERFDGTGYPYGLSGNMIPRGAQILTVADAFDAITCGRGYKKGVNFQEALKELERNSGTQFNPVYVKALKRVINKSFKNGVLF